MPLDDGFDLRLFVLRHDPKWVARARIASYSTIVSIIVSEQSARPHSQVKSTPPAWLWAS